MVAQPYIIALVVVVVIAIIIYALGFPFAGTFFLVGAAIIVLAFLFAHLRG